MYVERGDATGDRDRNFAGNAVCCRVVVISNCMNCLTTIYITTNYIITYIFINQAAGKHDFQNDFFRVITYLAWMMTNQ